MPILRRLREDTKNLTAFLMELLRANRGGEPAGIFSICSANMHVLEAGMHHAARKGMAVLIESTSNQANQFGGYTAMTPADFARFVKSVAEGVGFPAERIILGGDHLGPHVWQDEPAERAMEMARELVRSCVLAGYTKIHLDTSMRCGGDPGNAGVPLADELVTSRAADLCRVAERTHCTLPAGSPAPVYVIGTEVPPPGGIQAAESELPVTRVEDVARTLDLAHSAFSSSGLHEAWERVIAVVVQPGVEFGDDSVIEYDREKAQNLSRYAETERGLAYEAHSTDYQSSEKLKQMVEDHFAILKVGPWLTFAFREAIFALAQIEEEWLGRRRGITMSDIRSTIERVMIEDSRYWKKYYRGDESYICYARKYSFSDRCRYYWPRPEVQAALSRLLVNLSQAPIPLSLLSQYLPAQYDDVRQARIQNQPTPLIRAKITQVLDIYSSSCNFGDSHQNPPITPSQLS
jgi:D-tagatose-1,6-bisphosphate aldolase subunit GatZ/KbaZ